MENTEQYDLSIFPLDEQPILRQILQKYEKGDARRKVYNRLKEIYSFFDFQSILDLGIEKITDYINYLDDQDIQLHGKKRKLRVIIEILKYASLISHKDRRLEFLDKIEQIKYLSENLKNKGSRREKLFLNKAELYDILRYFEGKSLRNYIAISILCFSGCRVQPLVKLTVKDINFDRGFFKSRDKLTDNNYISTYFLPIPFLPILKYYINQEELSNEDLLIGITDKQIRKIVKTYPDPRIRSIHPHSFRHMFNSNFLLQGCPEFICEAFLNQKPKSVNRAHYNLLIQNFDYLQICYHYFFPYKEFFPGFDWVQWEKKYKEFSIQ